jgi:hypothetical protein
MDTFRCLFSVQILRADWTLVSIHTSLCELCLLKSLLILLASEVGHQPLWDAEFITPAFLQLHYSRSLPLAFRFGFPNRLQCDVNSQSHIMALFRYF